PWRPQPAAPARGWPGGGRAARGVEAKLVSSVVGRHFGCIKLGPGHHRASLPRDVRQIAIVLERELGFPVCAPDLSKAGYRLHSADSCGVDGMLGGHVVYERIADGQMLSIFSVHRIEALASSGAHDPGDPRCMVCNGKAPATVVGWHDARSTYLLCAKLPSAELIALAKGIN
ncbi:MAG: hypothetical protein ACE5EX_07400, partial [Phycisphaerae bacterium]